MITSLGFITNPADTISNLYQQQAESCIFFQFDHVQDYYGGEHILIGVVCYVNQYQLRLAFSADPEQLNQAIHASEVVDSDVLDSRIHQADGVSGLRQAFDALVVDAGLSDIDLLSPLRLDTVKIPKPWGQEIWYTGIEKRGVCSVQEVPLPWILEIVGSLITGTESLTPILLKILDPLPQEIVGDLYFELHQEKREVYIVTHVDKIAWPDSVGQIRYGFNPDKVLSFKNDEKFKAAYLGCVEEYRKVRDKIDLELDSQISNHAAGIDIDNAERFLARIDPGLIATEKNLREQMDEFTSLTPLVVGDVVQVQPFTPHSLQHGVRVIEFQTPHYERFILSFAQKVLTQEHWDTIEAMECVDVKDSNEAKQSYNLENESLIADFEEFNVTRFIIEPGTERNIGTSTYSLIIGVQGQVRVGETPILPEEGVYIPACIDSLTISNTEIEAATILIAQPTR